MKIQPLIATMYMTDYSFLKGINIESDYVIYGDGGTTVGKNIRIAAITLIVPGNHNFLSKNILIKYQGMSRKELKLLTMFE